jgi:hypothetical protein
MSVERRINIPGENEFRGTVEAIKRDVGLDEAIAEEIFARLSPEARARTSAAALVGRVRRRIDPKLVDALYQPLRAK